MDILISYGFVLFIVASIYFGFKNKFLASSITILALSPWLITFMVQDINRGNPGAVVFWVLLIVAYLYLAVDCFINHIEEKQAAAKKERLDKARDL
jgi:cobalamin biosynthesis protein CobD/CbiB